MLTRNNQSNMADELRNFLNTHWFKDGVESMKARIFVKRNLPERDFNFRVVFGKMNEPLTTAEEVNNLIKNLKYGNNKMAQESINRG